MKNTTIEWCDHTWNPWRGCTRVERALDCQNCYAATLGHRFGIEWGPHGIRVEKNEAGWREPFRWAKRPWICNECGSTCTASNGESLAACPKCECTVYAHRARVFALSMGDWLEDEPRTWTHGDQPQGGVPTAWLARMLDTIRHTPTLNWILVTKRPERFDRRLLDAQLWLIDRCKSAAPFSKRRDYAETASWLAYWRPGEIVPKNICIMASVGYQDAADTRIPHLLRIPARWHGLSLEPLLGPVALWLGAIKLQRPERFWLIPGGESGHGAWPCNVQWIRDIRDQGEIAGCPVFVKQLGARPFGRWAEGADLELPNSGWKLRIKHPKGGDPSEWPEDLRVRQFPEGL